MNWKMENYAWFSGTNDAFVTIALGKEKFQTTVKEKSTDPVEWSEQCELWVSEYLHLRDWVLFHSPICRTIPSHGNTADISLTVLHRNFLGVDEFLGQVSLPLRDFDVYERPKANWFPLKCKPGQTKNDYRGEIEVDVLFFTFEAFGLILCLLQTVLFWCYVVSRLNWVLQWRQQQMLEEVPLQTWTRKTRAQSHLFKRFVVYVLHLRNHTWLLFKDIWQYQRVFNEFGQEREKEHQKDCKIK